MVRRPLQKNDEKMKKCTCCGELKPLEQYSNDKSKKDGHRNPYGEEAE